MKWQNDLVKDIRTNTDYDDIDAWQQLENPHPFDYHKILPAPVEVTDCNRYALLNQFLKVRDKAKSILEIGIGRNSEQSFATVFIDNKKEDTIYVGIDIEDRSWLCDRGENIYTIQGDSSNYKEMVKIFEKDFSVKQFDFIFIDGWHSINQVLLDWEYTNLLSDDGIVGFHDTSCHPGPNAFINALDSKKWIVEKNLCPEDWGIGFAWKK